MDHLASAVKNITQKEKSELVKRIKSQKLKLTLFHYLSENPSAENKELNDLLFYKDSYTSLYTLKNRLFDDIIEIKLELYKTDFILKKEKIQNLRGLVYSKDKDSLLRELKKYEKSALNYELYYELKEIYFCFFLIYRNDEEQLNKYISLMKVADEKQMLIYEAETLFYGTLLDSQDLFYYCNDSSYELMQKTLDELSVINNRLNCKTTNFLYLSAALTLKLSSGKGIKDTEKTLEEINKLFSLYTYTFLRYRYPNCHIAIQCHYSMFYLLTGYEDMFLTVRDYIYEQLNGLRGYQMFDDTYFYNIYSSLLYYIIKKDPSRISYYSREIISEPEIEEKSDKMKNYFYYILAVENFYLGEYRKSSKYLSLSRNSVASLTKLSFWVYLENIFLNIIINIYQKDFDFVESEILLLKRKIKNFSSFKNILEEIKDMRKVIKQFEKTNNAEIISDYFNQLKNKCGILKLIMINPSLFSEPTRKYIIPEKLNLVIKNERS